MRYLSIGSLASLVFFGLANVSAIAAEQCGGMSGSSALPGHVQQCSATSKVKIVDSFHVADASEQKSCVSECVQVYSVCKTSRGRDCGQEYKTCSWKC